MLGCRFMHDVQSVNAYRYTSVVTGQEGDPLNVWFQLVDAELTDQDYGPVGRRYVPAAGATLLVEIKNVDDDRVISRYASQPYSTDDRSIWRLATTAADALAGTCSLAFTLTEGTVVTHWYVNGAIRMLDGGSL